MTTLQQNWPLMAIPVLVTIVGGLIAASFTLPPALRSTIQHFTAGVVFAAIAGEVIPDVIDRRVPIATIVGFIIGVALMFGISRVSDSLVPDAEEEPGTQPRGNLSVQAARFPAPLVTAVSIDGLVDGLVIGIGFTVGSTLGTLVTVALSLEMFFLGLSAAATLRQSGSPPRLAVMVTTAAALMIAIGAFLGVTVLGGLSNAGLAGTLAFGCAALLYLVTEELLHEAHTVPETRLMSSLFFAGFLTLLAVEMSI